jgi:hypothetical protein
MHTKQKKGTLKNQSALERVKDLLGAEDGVFASLGDAEFHHTLGGDLDGFAGGRITANPGGAIDEDQLAQARQGKLVFGLLVSQLSDGVEDFDSLLFGQRILFSDCGGDL